jgi:hypothetical protein
MVLFYILILNQETSLSAKVIIALILLVVGHFAAQYFLGGADRNFFLALLIHPLRFEHQQTEASIVPFVWELQPTASCNSQIT